MINTDKFAAEFLKGFHDQAFMIWKEQLALLYGKNYIKKFCTFDTFKKHFEALGYLKEDKGEAHSIICPECGYSMHIFDENRYRIYKCNNCNHSELVEE